MNSPVQWDVLLLGNFTEAELTSWRIHIKLFLHVTAKKGKISIIACVGAENAIIGGKRSCVNSALEEITNVIVLKTIFCRHLLLM